MSDLTATPVATRLCTGAVDGSPMTCADASRCPIDGCSMLSTLRLMAFGKALDDAHQLLIEGNPAGGPKGLLAAIERRPR